MSKLKQLMGVLILTPFLSTMAIAHHAFNAEFDAKQPIQITGTVTKTKWVNPHSWIYLDVTAPDGTVTNWGFEFGSVSALERLGLTKAKLPIGTVVTINGYRARNGGPFGYTVVATLKDGSNYKLGNPQDGAPEVAAAY